jgi:O-antigen/teichoic acid export membrane protein
MRKHFQSSLSINSLWIMATTMVNAALGYGYWIAVSRLFAPNLVGQAAGLIALMTVVSLVSNLGLVSVVVHRLPQRSSPAQWSSTISVSIFGGAVLGVLGAVIVLLALPLLSRDLDEGAQGLTFSLLFVLGTAAWTIGSVLDYVFIAERSSGAMTVRNGVLGLVKIPLVLLPLISGEVSRSVTTIFFSWVAASAVSCGLALWLVLPRIRPGARLTFDGILEEARAMAGLMAGNHLVTLGNTLPTLLLPIIVASRVSVTQNAYFYMTWLIGGLFFMISSAVGSSLFAEGSHHPERVYRQLLSSARLTSLLLAPAMAFVFVAGSWILGVFGNDYATNGTGLLMILTFSAIPDAVTNLYVAVLRVRRRLRAAAVLAIGMAAVAVIGGWLLAPRYGLEGVGVAWIVAQLVGSLWVASDVRALRRASGTQQALV